LRVTNFCANGESLTLDDITDLSFSSVTISDAQSSGKDSVYVIANSVSNNLGKLAAQVNPVDLEALSGVSAPVSEFSLGTSTTSIYNKWSVNSIEVAYSINWSTSSAYSIWAFENGLNGDDALSDADVENGGMGDGYNNLAEYALGMNPTLSDAGSRGWENLTDEGGTNWFEYVHYRRSDYTNQGLTYLLIDSTNLVDSVSNTNAQDQVLVGPAVDGYEPVTNRYNTDDPVKFIKLIIQQD
jgi:hypothetical protein